MDFSKDGQSRAIVLSGAAAPQDIWMLDMRTKQFTQLTHSPHAGVDLTKMARPELVRYKAHDGLELSGWLYRPHGKKGPGRSSLAFTAAPKVRSAPVSTAPTRRSSAWHRRLRTQRARLVRVRKKVRQP
jgi:dipeptidyl aminopeptidase/acylaminoacyl peptidase